MNPPQPKTVSEALFETFCKQRRLRAERIPTASDLGQKRPDYRVRSPYRRARWVYVEVKEVQPRKDEADKVARVLAGEAGIVFGTTPGEKMRAFIKKARPQFRMVPRGANPAVIVVHEPSRILNQHVDPYGILTAMRGLDEVDVSLPPDRAEPPTFGPLHSGGKRKMTPRHNTTISAIAVLRRYGPRATELAVYHNRFARCPLRLHDLAGQWIRHYVMSPDEREWRLLAET